MSSETGPEVHLQKIAQSSSRREIFEYALAGLLAQLNPERALIAYRDKDTDELSAQASHGLDPQTVFVAGEISTELIKSVLREGQSVCLVDAISHPSLQNRTSVILSGLRSIVCVPIIHPSRLVIGLIYADNRIRAGAFEASHQTWMEELSRTVVENLLRVSRQSQDSGSRQAEPSASTSVQAETSWNQHRQEAFRRFRAGEVAPAIEVLEGALSHARSFGTRDVRLGKTLGELAEMQRQNRQFQEAERHFIQAVDQLESLGPQYRSELAPVLTNLATLYFSQNNGIQAEGLYRRVLEIWAGSLSSDDKRLAPVYYNLATLRRSAGDDQEARALFQRALAIAEKAWGPEHAHSQRCRAALEQPQP